jgi:prepilin-type N-terminal cleavage/methylation domain-containing protein
MRQQVKRHFKDAESGFTIVELLVTFAIISVLSGIAVMNLNALSNSSENAAASLVGLLKQARARAIASTSAYFVVPISSTSIVTRSGTTCSDASPVDDPTLTLQLASGATLGSTSWSVCFTSRGLSDSNTEIVVNDIHSHSLTVEVFLGGGVQIN